MTPPAGAVLFVAAWATACGSGPAGPTDDRAAVTQWLQSRAVAFDSDDPEYPSRDLQPVRAMVGEARVVSLGEATHGTSEFFRMKHRLLRFLVDEMGFTVFGIEASFPDCEPIDAHVRTGRGDPRALLAGQGFWTWTTEEVLDMLLWMRRYNELHGPVLRFRGFDMQHPISGMESAIAFLRLVDPAAAGEAEGLYAPYRPYADWESAGRYHSLSADVRQRAHDGVAAVEAILATGRERYESASSAAAFADALQAANTVVQAEALYAGTGDRDAFMAENAGWLVDQAGPSARAILWAHNAHVQRWSPNVSTMGGGLARRFGAQMVVFGFAFYQGSFTAAGGTSTAPPAVAGSYEEAFRRTDLPRFLLDTRGLVRGSPGPEWFLAGHPHRNIGAIYNPSQDYFAFALMDRAYDVVVYFQDSTPSRVYRP